ncbi:MAG: protein kinase [Isosphaeraceae bacterium]
MGQSDDRSHDLLLGLLALQVGLVDRARLVDTFAAGGKSAVLGLANRLKAQGALTDSRLALLNALAEEHLALHGGDPQRSLAALEIDRSTLDALSQGMPGEFAATLSYVGSGSTRGLGDGGAYAAFEPESAAVGDHRYRVLRPHARGGLGAVFVALDTELNREVALKEILDRHADDPIYRQRFLVEAEITGGLEHPGIVPVYGLGTYDGGRPYYAMRFIKGDSLKEAIDAFHTTVPRAGSDETTVVVASGNAGGSTRIKGGRSAVADPSKSLLFRNLLRRFTDVCNAIDYAHSRGVLHRDIKPGNVIVGKYGETLVVDWGLAKPLGSTGPAIQGERPLTPSSGAGSAETLPGAALGTPGYMSPEQAAGDLDRLGARSDVYSLGATLYAILTGEPPFTGEIHDLLARVQRGEFRAVRAIDPAVPATLEAVCHKAMALRPEDRYASARALADDVERWLADEPVLARQEPIVERARRWARRHRTGVAASLTAAAVALVGVGALAIFQAWANHRLSEANHDLILANLRESRARTEEQRARTRAEARIDLAMSAIEQFRQVVENNLDLKDRPEHTPLRRSLLQAPSRFYQALRDDLQADARSDSAAKLKLAEALNSLSSLSRELGSQTEALTLLSESLGLTEEIVGLASATESVRRGARDLRLDLLCALGIVREVLADKTAARAAFDQGRREALAEIQERPKDPAVRLLLARLLYSMAMNRFDSGDLDEALAHSDAAFQQIDEALRLTPDDGEAEELRWVVHATLRVPILLKRNRPEESLVANEQARTAAQRARALGRASHLLESAEASLLSNQADAYELLGRDRERRDALRNSVEAYRKVISTRPTSYTPRMELADVLLDHARAERAAGESATATSSLVEATALLEALRAEFPNSAPLLAKLAEAMNTTGTFAYQDGRPDDAIAAFRKVSNYSEAHLALLPDQVATIASLAGNEYNLGFLLNATDKIDQAKASYERSERLRRQLVREHPDQPLHRLHLAHTLGNLAGLTQREEEDAEKCERLLREAVDLLSGLAREFPKSAPVRDSLARNTTSLCSLLINDLKLDEADRRVLEVRPFLAERVKADPQAIQPRIDLAFNLREQAAIDRLTGREAEARRVLREAIALIEPAIASGSDQIDLPRALALGELNLARFMDQPEEAVEAVDLAARAASRLESIHAAGKVDSETTSLLIEAHQTQARRLAFLGRRDEADAAFRRGQAHRAPESLRAPDSGRVELLAWAGDFDQFLAGCDAIDAAGGLPDERLLSMAAAASLASKRCDPERAALLAERAIRWLVKARDLGTFRHGQDRSILLKPEYAPLKGMKDFQLLWLDVAFPRDPFARISKAND